MFARLPRRKRQVAWTAALAVAFLAVAGLVAAAVLGRGEAYTPGEEVEGLTSELSRDLPDDPPDVQFTRVTAEAGIRFRHFPAARTTQLPEDMGSGAAWGDYDNDGWPDLFLVDIAHPLPRPDAGEPTASAGGSGDPGGSRLYRNLGDGTFRDVTEEAGIDHREVGMGAAWADVDNDGWRDLLVTGYGTSRLYRNRGDGTFEDVSRMAGLDQAGFWTGVAWGDYDRDGWIDAYVTGYVRYSPGAGLGGAQLQYDVEVPASINPSSFRPQRNLLLHNRGDGTFQDVAAAAGVEGAEGRSLSAAWTDFDDDGLLDLYVANDVSDNVLYRNRGDGTFEDISHAALVADYRGAMGLAVGDWDGDGDTDLFITHWIAQENALFSNRLADLRAAGHEGPRLQFFDEADRFGLGQIALDDIGWGTSFFDYDNDGWLDLFVANGSTFQRADDPTRLEPMPDRLYWNRGPEEGFFDVSSRAGPYFGERHVGRGAAFADYDRDGDVDVVVMNHGEPPALLRNDGGNARPWISVVLDGRRSGRDAVGAVVRIVAGGQEQRRRVGAQSSYLSQNDASLHVGLGAAAVVDTVEIVWPSGLHQVWSDVEARRAYRIVEGDAALEVLAETPLPPGAVPAAEEGLDARERTLRFWDRYRAATRHRVAGELAEAARAYEAALALEPEHEDALYYLAGVADALGEHERAVSALERLIAIDPRSGRAHVRLGAFHTCPRSDAPLDLARAKQAFETAFAINREQVGPSIWLGLVDLLRDDLDAATRHFEIVLGSDRANVTALALLGYVDWRTGRYERARDRWQAAREAPGAPGDLGLREGDTRGERSLFAGAESCGWLERALAEVLGTAPAAGVASTEAALRPVFGPLDRQLAAARRAHGR